jgi:hypothetical protein
VCIGADDDRAPGGRPFMAAAAVMPGLSGRAAHLARAISRVRWGPTVDDEDLELAEVVL